MKIIKREKMFNGLIICFLGIDGSGKSTLSRYLYKEFKQRDLDPSYTWWLEGEDSLLRRLFRRLGKQNLKSQSNNTLKTNGLKNKLIYKIFYNTYPWIVLLDYLRFTLLNITIPKKIYNKKLMIFDRFYLDVVLATYRDFNLSKSSLYKIIGIFKIFAGTPDIIFFVDVSPETALSRKIVFVSIYLNNNYGVMSWVTTIV